MNVDATIAEAIARIHAGIDLRIALALAKSRAKNPRRVVGQWARKDRTRGQ